MFENVFLLHGHAEGSEDRETINLIRHFVRNERPGVRIPLPPCR